MDSYYLIKFPPLLGNNSFLNKQYSLLLKRIIVIVVYFLNKHVSLSNKVHLSRRIHPIIFVFEIFMRFIISLIWVAVVEPLEVTK